MQEDVCLILNEREPLKKEMADELQEQLRLRDLVCERMEPCENLTAIIRERGPKVLVLDYLLGDVATALDVLPELETGGDGAETEIVLWTDEPSVGVAVSAMKLGAQDYIQLNPTSGLEKVVGAIEELLRSQPARKQISANVGRARSFATPVGNSRAFQAVVNLASSIAQRSQNISIIHGPTGSGRSHLAQYIHASRNRSGTFIEHDLDTWTGSAEEVWQASATTPSVPFLSFTNTVFLDHAESDPGELLDWIATSKSEIWSDDTPDRSPMLIVGTSSEEVAQAWVRLAGAERVDLPALAERDEDFWPLIQAFLKEVKEFGAANKLKFSPTIVQKLLAEEWPGNVKQLRGSIVEAASIPLEGLQALHGGDEKQFEELSKSEELTLIAILDAKERWERYHWSTPAEPNPMLARQAYDAALGNYRIAAAKLGTSVAVLRQLISKKDTSGPEENTTEEK